MSSDRPEERYFRTSVAKRQGGRGGYWAILQDITETVTVVRKLEKELSLYRELVESSDALIWQVDSQQQCTYLNPAWEKTFGYSREEMIGHPFWDFLREILGDILSRLGCCPLTAATGEEAIRLYKQAAILDLTVPGGMGGKETVKLLHECDPSLPVFVSSGYSEDPVMSSPKDYEFAGSISKPFRLHEICDTLTAYFVED